MKTVILPSLLLLAGCASAPSAPKTGSSGVPVAPEFEDTVRMSNGLDSNVYDFSQRRAGARRFDIRLTPTSGPDATISGGTMADRKDRALKQGAWFGARLCQSNKAPVISGETFRAEQNAWDMCVQCAG